MILDWSTITLQAFQNVWQGTVEFLPKLIIGLVVFILGWLISSGIGKIVARILRQISFDKIFERSGWRQALEGADIKVSPSEFVGAIIKWILVIVFLMVFVEILGFGQFAVFLSGVIVWLPNVVIAAAIFVVAIIVADILEKILKSSVRKLEIKYSEVLGAIVKGAIYVFATFAILAQLNVASEIINTMVTGFVGMLALAFGLAFGLGGKDVAAEILRSLKNKLTEK
jgi:hypothetical protein